MEICTDKRFFDDAEDEAEKDELLEQVECGDVLELESEYGPSSQSQEACAKYKTCKMKYILDKRQHKNWCICKSMI